MATLTFLGWDASFRMSDALIDRLSKVAPHFTEELQAHEEHLVQRFFPTSKNHQTPENTETIIAATPHTIKEFEFASLGPKTLRDALGLHGIDLSMTYTSDIASNPVGGAVPGGSAYADNIALGCLLDTERLFGWHGGYFMLSALQCDGSNLSATHIHNQFRVQQVYRGEGLKWYELSYQHYFLKDRASLKLGRIGAGDDFDVSPLYWLYMNAAIDARINAFHVDSQLSAAPNASWGSRLKADLTKNTALRVGVYQVSDSSSNGLRWNFYPNNGVLFLGQYSWNPEFFKPGIKTSVPSSLNPHLGAGTWANETHLPLDRSFEQPSPSFFEKGLPGHYFAGAYYSTKQYQQFQNALQTTQTYGFYAHADQMVYRRHPSKEEGLTLWSAASLSPQQNIALLPFQINVGALYTGLLPPRPNDMMILGAGYANFSNSYGDAEASLGKGNPSYELMYEWGYRINLTKFAYVQPDLQWILHPGGTGTIPNALVIGVQTGIIF